MTSVAWPLEKALDTALRGDSQLITALTYTTGTGASDVAVFSVGCVPPNFASDYIVLGTSIENTIPLFNGRDAKNNGVEINIWSPVLGKQRILTLYGHVERVLHNKVLTMTGSTMIMGGVELLAAMTDEDGKFMHAVVQYTVRSWNA